MKKSKIFVLMLSLLVGVFTLAACGNDETEEDVTVPDEELREFTLEELSQYDGEDDNDAYIAVDGYVYDVTDSTQWMEGSHQGSVTAGQDLTEAMDNNERHGREMLERVPRIGILLDENDSSDDDADDDADDYTDDTDTGSGY